MQEFRPASVVAADTELAERLMAGDEAAVRSLVDRYGAAVVAAITPAVGAGDAVSVACDVFVEAQRRTIQPGDNFAPWLAEIATARAGAVDERRWELAQAIAAVDPQIREALRRHHVEGHRETFSELDDELARHELRLQRRLVHIGDADAITTALASADVWLEADPELAERVVTALGAASASSSTGASATATGVADQSGDPRPRSLVSRSLRPVLLGIAGALALLLVAIVVLSAASGTPVQPDYTVELIPTGVLVEVVGGEITVTERDAGLEIEFEALTLPRRGAGSFYEGRLGLADGSVISTGTFAQGDSVTLWGGATLDEAIEFEVVTRDAADTGGADDVVLKADLPRP